MLSKYAYVLSTNKWTSSLRETKFCHDFSSLRHFSWVQREKQYMTFNPYCCAISFKLPSQIFIRMLLFVFKMLKLQVGVGRPLSSISYRRTHTLDSHVSPARYHLVSKPADSYSETQNRQVYHMKTHRTYTGPCKPTPIEVMYGGTAKGVTGTTETLKGITEGLLYIFAQGLKGNIESFQ